MKRNFNNLSLSQDLEWKPPMDNGFNLSSIDQTIPEKSISHI